MSLSPAVIDALVDAGVTVEQLAAAFKADLADADQAADIKRGKDAERQRRHRMSRGVTVTNGDSVTIVPPPTPPNKSPPHPQKLTPPPTPPCNSRARKGASDFELPDRIPADEWRGFEEMRKAIGKPLADYGRQLAVARLDKLAEAGWPPGVVLKNSILNNYQGLFPPKDDNDGRQRTNTVGGTGTNQGIGRTTAAALSVIDRLNQRTGYL